MRLRLPTNVPPPGTTIVADKDLRSRALETELAEHHLALIRPASTNEPDPGIYPAWLRQRIESAVPPRIVQRLLALNGAIWHNRQTGADQKCSLSAWDH
jgi:hypothetical protein